MIHRLDDPSLFAQRQIIVDEGSAREDLHMAVYNASQLLAKRIAHDLAGDPAPPTGHELVPCMTLPHPYWGVITTKNDLRTVGKGITDTLGDCVTGYMDFGNLHGAALLKSPVRELCLPDTASKHIDTLVIGKAILATGCTAISLTKTALSHFVPSRVVIVSIFYSQSGLREVASNFPAAHIYIIGEPDFLGSKWIEALV